MMGNFFIGAALLLLSLHAADAAKSTGSDDALDAGLGDDARAAGLPVVTPVPVAPPVTTVRVVAPPTGWLDIRRPPTVNQLFDSING
jgi:hypothetical protein